MESPQTLLPTLEALPICGPGQTTQWPGPGHPLLGRFKWAALCMATLPGYPSLTATDASCSPSLPGSTLTASN